MMQAAEDLARLDRADGRRLDGAGLGRVLDQREVGTAAVVVAGVLLEQPSRVAFTDDDDVVEQLSTKRPDDALAVRVLPRRRGLSLPKTSNAT
jgi:hypothetical protein